MIAGHCARSDSSVSSSFSRFRFAEQGPHNLPICTQCSLLKSGSQLSRKSERLHLPTGRASTVCRTFGMTYVHVYTVVITLKHNGNSVPPLERLRALYFASIVCVCVCVCVFHMIHHTATFSLNSINCYL